MDRPKIIVITGPTATGKTALGALCAKAFGGEVVSADSMQVYQFMDIGTAKPTQEEMLDIAHHLLDFVPPWENYSAARYISDAATCIDSVLSRGNVPVLVGGTGLYIDSLLSGRGFSARGDLKLRLELEMEYDTVGGEAMLRRLHEFDAESATKLHFNDKKRIVRAIEVFETTRKPISQHDRETIALPPRYDAVKFALTYSNRADLYARIDQRFDSMISMGLEREVRSLLKMGVKPTNTSMQAIGYKEMTNFILGETDISDAVEKSKMESRRYAKRQLSWLRRDFSTNWVLWDSLPDINRAIELIITTCGGINEAK